MGDGNVTGYVTFERLYPLLDRPRQRGGWIVSYCPAHEDDVRSLGLSKRGVLKCFGGCTFKEIMKAFDVSPDREYEAPSFLPKESVQEEGKEVAVYDYGALEKVRIEYPNPLGGKPRKRFIWRDKETKLAPGEGAAANAPLWRSESLSGPVVFFTEGEKAADACFKRDIPAVAHSGGAGITNFGSSLDCLSDREVVLWADDDTPGRKYMHNVAEALKGKAKVIRYLDTGDLIGKRGESKEDAVEFFQNGGAGYSLEDLLEKSVIIYKDTGQYPLHVFPPTAQEFVRAASVSVGVPPEMVGLPLMAATASVIGSSIELELKPGFTVVPIIWGATVVDPGKRKTPAEQTVTSILEDLQLDAYKIYSETVASLPEEARDRVKMDHFLTTDTTIEALAVLLASSPGILITPDELTAWVKSFDAYHKGADRQKYLSLWSGKALKVDRKSAPPIFVKHPAPSIFGGIQPDFLRELVNSSGRDGFFERFLFCVPEVASSRWTEEYLPKHVSQNVRSMFEELRTHLVGGEVLTLYLSDEAKESWVSWYDETMRRADNVSSSLQGFLLKLPQQVARIAIVLHALQFTDSELISKQIMEGAIEIGEYHYSQAEKAFALLKKK